MKRSLLFAVLALLVVTPRIQAGSTYGWTGLATGLGFQLDDYNNDQQLIPIPEPSSVTVSLSYDPSYWSGPNAPVLSPPLGTLTSADAASYSLANPDGNSLGGAPFFLSISSNSTVWPGFSTAQGESDATLTVLVPPDGQGPDLIMFAVQGEPIIRNPTEQGPGPPSSAWVVLEAPAGTLNSPDVLPETRAGFGTPIGTLAGGHWYINSSDGYIGSDFGPLGLVPEPSSVLSLVLGIGGVWLAYAFRRTRNRRGLVGSPTVESRPDDLTN